ncbi:aldehyde dehydrogenase [Aliamphritea hakodatensis]|uniref:aldehyde dehydrogenase n=1 Tax=Aliamphritea hakodatensis TaxID=2895352 RepID=UPI0022FD6D88|nr:aldehyde dehydrogenase [Aliamphritea hakodatensis]
MRNLEQITGQRLSHYINGQWHEPSNGEYFDSLDPTNAQPWYKVASGDAQDIEDAVSAARAALKNPQWQRMSQTDRGHMVRRLAQLIDENREMLARIETRDNGKLLRETRAQTTIVPDTFSYFAGAADKLEGTTIPLNKPDMLNYTVREPIGVVGIIVPWNSPLYQLAWTLAPCLAIGNTVVIKPSEHTSASTLALMDLVEQAGFPPGVVNVVTGFGPVAGEALTRHPHIAKIAFTGSSETGKRVAANAASHLAQCNMELGGKSPHCVFDDADLDRAANGVVAGIFAAAGQTCVAGSRIFVQESVYDAFLDKLLTRTRQIKLGDPTEEGVQVGPLAIREQLEKVTRYVEIAKAEGATLLSGGKPPEDPALSEGWYFEPTLFTDVDNSMRIAQEEVFGPVGCVIRFSTEEELTELANATEYGLAAGVWTQSMERGLRFAREVESGIVWVNTYRAASFATPVGGFKNSGYGSHNGLESLREYSRSKSVMLDYSGKAQDPFVIRVKE